MARLEIKESRRKGKGKKFRLHLDGVEIQEDSSYKLYTLLKVDNEKTKFRVSIRDNELSDLVCSLENGHLSDQIEELHPIEYCDGIFIKDELFSLKIEFQDDHERYLIMSTALNLSHWKKAWSPQEFLDEIYDLADRLSGKAYIEEGSELYGFDFLFLFEDKNTTIDQELDKREKEIAGLWEIANKNLQAEIDANSIISHFSFPSAIRSSCEEYLISFIQFLKDVGVEATADLKHEGQAGQVLFSVTPAKGKEALGKIRQALDVYLELAGATSFEYESGASIQVDRLESRILFFQSQIKLAQAEAKAQLAEIQHQEKTIEAQEATILAQRVTMGHISTSNVFLQSRVKLLDEERADKDELEFFGGLVKFSNPEAFGFSVNLARLLALLKPIMIEEQPPLQSGELPALARASDE